MTQSITVEDRGRGPQLSTSRITVLDVFYYVHRGHDFDAVHEAMPTLSRAEFDVVMEYVVTHRDELVERDRLAVESIRREIAEQRSKGFYSDIDESIPLDQRIALMKKKLHQQLAGKTSDRAAG
jgi:hypothetical protein